MRAAAEFDCDLSRVSVCFSFSWPRPHWPRKANLRSPILRPAGFSAGSISPSFSPCLSMASARRFPISAAHAEEISQKIAEGARAREAAEKRRSEAQAKLANIGTEVAEMRVEAKRGGGAGSGARARAGARRGGNDRASRAGGNRRGRARRAPGIENAGRAHGHRARRSAAATGTDAEGRSGALP